jgi:abortive infection bacteriophage resistance protein
LATYNKPHLSLDDQLVLLKQRGLQVTDDVAAKEFLRHNGYYRLSAYWYPFREIVGSHRSDNFLPNSKFEDVRDLCSFDKKFKLLLLDAIEGVEIAVRAEIALLLGASDTFAHINPNFFRPSFIKLDPLGKTKHQEWLKKFNGSVNRSKDEFVLHHERKYGNRSTLPIWIAIELWDFGLLSHFYSGMDTTHCISVATRFSISNWKFMASWLRSLNYVRNVIAHHGRLWNLNLVESPSLPSRRGLMADFDALVPLHSVNTRIYSICCILSHFSKSINQRSSWSQRLTEFINSFPAMPYISVQDMGFPTNWQNHNFWK